MFTEKEWHEFLYACDLVGHQWLHVNRVGIAYIYWRLQRAVPFKPSPWSDKVQETVDSFQANPERGEETLAQLLAEAHYGPGGVESVIPEESRQKIVKMLHYIVNEKPNPDEWVN